MESDSYKTVSVGGKGLYKDKGSKFIAIAKHIDSEEDFKVFMTELKKEYYDARHHCYAWRLGPEDDRFRSNDDGEPSGTAGKPMLNQLLSNELYYTALIVVRYFGGTKLGVPGLISAYKNSAKEAIENSVKRKKFIYKTLELAFEYPRLNDIMRIVKEHELKILTQDFQLDCLMSLNVKKNDIQNIINRLSIFHDIKIKEL
ncbi:MAG: YigZ family protein [Chlorobi bacterium]|nr:YigZ family protein [Chlorobiota bacterium]